VPRRVSGITFIGYAQSENIWKSCDPLNNVYYHKQLRECLQCEKCPVGMGKITLEVRSYNDFVCKSKMESYNIGLNRTYVTQTEHV
jgi:hypothetical protein